MAIGDVFEVPGVADLYYLDTGMYDVAEYGSVFVYDTDRPALVDTGLGPSYELVLDALASLGISPADLELVVPTHVHLDHAGGAGFLAEACPNAGVYVHEVGAPHLVDPGRLWEGTRRAVGSLFEYYVEPRPVPADRVTELSDGDVLDLGNRILDVYHAPGHAPHQVVLFDPDDRVLFTADAAGIYVQERDEVRPTSPPSDFDLEQCLVDVETQQALDPEMLCYGHYGHCPAGDELATYASVIREWVADIAAVRDELGDDDAVVAHFVETNDLDEVWGARKVDPEIAMNVRGVLRYLDQRG
ncbi:MAG: MBL fold metallo-hydrolase [Haloarculaceae archaeon]